VKGFARVPILGIGGAPELSATVNAATNHNALKPGYFFQPPLTPESPD
jgi:hypothetical protein